MPAPLTLYKSSAGSGKTFTLVKEYLRLCLEDPDRFKKVVAITFTNAAAAEMKERILQRLKSLSSGTDFAFEEILRQDGVSEQAIRNAPVLLEKILYNYSHFNIGTIDSFFHRILRAFSKELGLPMGFDIFLDTDDALTYAVDNLLHRSHTQADVHKVLTAFVQEKVNNGQSWHIREDLMQMANELIKDNAMLRGDASLEDIFAFAGQLREMIHAFEKEMDTIGAETIRQLAQQGLGVDDFSNKSAGPAGYFQKIRRVKKEYEPGKRFTEAMDDEKKWLTAASLKSAQAKGLQEAVKNVLMSAGRDALRLYEEKYPAYLTAKEVHRSVYTFAVYEELNKILEEYRTDKEVVLISDFTKILARHILQEDIGFIYSKIGARYEHFLIDEFQDTSSLQWFGLRPLIENAVAQGSSCLVVGDSKQAIYRWRGGEVELIEHGITERDFRDYSRELRLSQNFRSRHEVIAFNNRFFNEVKNLFPAGQSEFQTLRKIFDDASQQPGSANAGGYVEINFLLKEGNRKETFMSKSEEIILRHVHDCLTSGYRLRDIAMLVRSGAEASSLARMFVEEGLAFVTQDSLSIDHSPAIRLLFSVLAYLDDHADELARTQTAFLYLTYFKNSGTHTTPFHEILNGNKSENSDSPAEGLPTEFTERLAQLSSMPVYEIVENAIRIFNLNDKPDAYLQRFQDLVLEFTLSQGYGIRAFLEWWKEGHYSVILPEDQDAIRILTIHKSKGLEYPVVMIPYASWDFKSARSDLIWVQPDEEPFNSFPALPVHASETLSRSLFSEAYGRESAHIAIDNLNLLYVAFTRAKDRLYVNSQAYKEQREEVKNIAQVIAGVLLRDDQYGKEDKISFGDPIPNPVRKERSDSADTLELPEYIATDWSDRVKLAR